MSNWWPFSRRKEQREIRLQRELLRFVTWGGRVPLRNHPRLTPVPVSDDLEAVIEWRNRE